MTSVRIEYVHRFGVSVVEGFHFITDQANWPVYWPGFVRIQPGSRWGTVGDETRLVVRLLGREVELHMTLERVEPNRLVEYTSAQPGLPDARHERHFGGDGQGFDYRLVVEYEPRPGWRGLYDRIVVRRAVARTLRATVRNLDTAFAG